MSFYLSLSVPSLVLNFDAAPNYEAMFGPHEVLYLICETAL